MRIRTGLATLLMATTLLVPASSAQDAGTGATSNVNCATLATFGESEARAFLQGYLAARRDTFSAWQQAGAAANSGAGDTAGQTAGADGAMPPKGGTAQDPATSTAAGGASAQASAGATAASPGASATSGNATSADSQIDAAIAACAGGADRGLYDIAGEVDPRDPMDREAGLAGEGAPKPD